MKRRQRRLVTSIYYAGRGVWVVDLECGHAARGKTLASIAATWRKGVSWCYCPDCPKTGR